MGDPSQRTGYGLSLAFVATISFAATIILLAVILSELDAVTTTFYRCFIGAVVITAYRSMQSQELIPPGTWNKSNLFKLILISALFASYQLFANFALVHIPPSSVQVLGQFSIVLTIICGIFLLKEPFSKNQVAGLAVLIIGLGLFFHHRWAGIINVEGAYIFGLAFMGLSTCAWTACIITQKIAVKTLPSSVITLAYFWLSAVILLPLSSPLNPSLQELSLLIPVILAGFTTVFGAGCYTEALKHADSSRVSPIVALTPLFTMLLVYPALTIWPGAFTPETVDIISLAGTVLVVIGSTLASFAKK